MSRHHRLYAMEETRLLRDFQKHGFYPELHYAGFFDGEFGEEDHSRDGWIPPHHSRDGWIMFPPHMAADLLDRLDEIH